MWQINKNRHLDTYPATYKHTEQVIKVTLWGLFWNPAFAVRWQRCFHHLTMVPFSDDPSLLLCRGRGREEKGQDRVRWCGVGVKSLGRCLFPLNTKRIINIFNLGPSYYFSHHCTGKQSKVAHILALKRSIWQAHLRYVPIWRPGGLVGWGWRL